MPMNSMYLYTIFNFKGKIKGQNELGVGGWGLISTLNDRAIKIEKDYFQTNLVERSFCKSVFTFNKPYSKTFICTTEINAYLIVTYLKTIFFSTGYQSVFLSFTCCGVQDWKI